jgi:hypothetical protein
MSSARFVTRLLGGWWKQYSGHSGGLRCPLPSPLRLFSHQEFPLPHRRVPAPGLWKPTLICGFGQDLGLITQRSTACTTGSEPTEIVMEWKADAPSGTSFAETVMAGLGEIVSTCSPSESRSLCRSGVHCCPGGRMPSSDGVPGQRQELEGLPVARSLGIVQRCKAGTELGSRRRWSASRTARRRGASPTPRPPSGRPQGRQGHGRSGRPPGRG